MTNLLWLALGVVLLYVGGEALVDGARRLAFRLGIRPMVIGLTVVALGTSAPELAASLAAALDGAPEVAFGNIVGSNIANLALVLGLGAVIHALRVEGRFLWREMPFMLLASVLMILFARDGEIVRVEGVVLLLMLGGFLTMLLGLERDQPEVEQSFDEEFAVKARMPIWWLTSLIVLGIVGLTLGAKALIIGAIGIARAMGIEERVIGLTVVAFGTSLPEVAGTLVAAARREGDLILGNLIGSNVFNILFILGTTVIVHPISIDASSAMTDMLVMLAVSVLVWPLMFTGKRLGRWEGVALLTCYVVYVGWLFAGR